MNKHIYVNLLEELIEKGINEFGAFGVPIHSHKEIGERVRKETIIPRMKEAIEKECLLIIEFGELLGLPITLAESIFKNIDEEFEKEQFVNRFRMAISETHHMRSYLVIDSVLNNEQKGRCF